MGIIWGVRYLKDSHRAAKIHGIVLIGITIVELIVLIVWMINLIHTVNTTVNQQMNGLQGF